MTNLNKIQKFIIFIETFAFDPKLLHLKSLVNNALKTVTNTLNVLVYKQHHSLKSLFRLYRSKLFASFCALDYEIFTSCDKERKRVYLNTFTN